MNHPDSLTIDKLIRTVLRDHGRLQKDPLTIADLDDLFQAGMTSHSSVNVMLALEGALDVEFPDHMLKRSVFASVNAIREALSQLPGTRSLQ
jgi:acyl carrier protein